MIHSIYSSLDSRASRIKQYRYLFLLGLFLVAASLMLSGWLSSASNPLLASWMPTTSESPSVNKNALAGSLDGKNTFTFRELDIHPDRRHRTYTAAPFVVLDSMPVFSDQIEDFRHLLNVYVQRQAIDDNFTIRVYDLRTNTMLERYTLEAQKRRFMLTGEANWEEIDQYRSVVTSRLIGKYSRRGVPTTSIMIKWGRADQVALARERETPFIEYEIQLARFLDMSLLSTEVGTVETFNSDKLVSEVGARGRYQIMPGMLKKNGIHTYALPVRQGGTINVMEEWHPLLTMEPAFIIMKAYSNAVGHEIPGISAYHTGPFNILRIYDRYLQDQTTRYTPSSTVMDAYMWALTDGFEQIAEDTGFRKHSRSYIPSAYGALRSTENIPIDTTQTQIMERVQLKRGAWIYLSDLLEALHPWEEALDWGMAESDSTLYDRFRTLNPHFELPDAGWDTRLVPGAGNILLTATRSGNDVRFFMPKGASKRLLLSGVPVIDLDRIFNFDHNTFTLPSDEELTVWDKQYRDLIDDTAYFGFTEENRTWLNILVDRFEEMAAENPSHYRLMQLKVIKLHRQLWRTRLWVDLSNTTAAAAKRVREHSLPSMPVTLTPRLVAQDPLLQFEATP